MSMNVTIVTLACLQSRSMEGYPNIGNSYTDQKTQQFLGYIFINTQRFWSVLVLNEFFGHVEHNKWLDYHFDN